MKAGELTDFWGSSYLNLNAEGPDKIVPSLLAMNTSYRGKCVPKEVFMLLVAYKFRNYAGHNIKQQNVVTTEYDRIILFLLFALLSVQSL